MKRLFLIAIITLISVSVKAQNNNLQQDTIPVINGDYQFQDVVNVNPTLKKEQLYRNAKIYFMDVFVGAKDAFQYDDKEEGRIIGKGMISVNDYKSTFPGVAALKWDVNYNVEIICKDGKYRYRLYDIAVVKESHVAENNYRTVHLTMKDIYEEMPKQKGAYKALYPKVINKLAAEFKTNIITLKECMEKQPANYSAAF